jgi:hypothetical protein
MSKKSSKSKKKKAQKNEYPKKDKRLAKYRVLATQALSIDLSNNVENLTIQGVTCRIAIKPAHQELELDEWSIGVTRHSGRGVSIRQDHYSIARDTVRLDYADNLCRLAEPSASEAALRG